jgi:hypothetical protein
MIDEYHDDLDKLPFYPTVAVDESTVLVIIFETCTIGPNGPTFGGDRILVFDHECSTHQAAVELMDRIDDFLEDFAESDREKIYNLTVPEFYAMLRARFTN